MNKETVTNTVVATLATMVTAKVVSKVFTKAKDVVIKKVTPKDVEGKLADIEFKINGYVHNYSAL